MVASETSACLRLLVVSAEAGDVELLRSALEPARELDTSYALGLADARSELGARTGGPDVVLVTQELLESSEFAELLSPRVATIVLLAAGQSVLPVALSSRGVVDVVARCPDAIGQMPDIVRRADRQWRLMRELSLAEIELSARAAEVERAARRARAIQQLSERLGTASNSDECWRYFAESVQSAFEASVELWRGDVPEHVEEPVRRLAAEVRRSEKILSYQDLAAPPGRRAVLIAPVWRRDPAPDLAV
ncbi:MAG TPA: hypothetical protein VG963_29310, partial [Polyangiaceae bacterium]|nr:hypothetical protein [Polyangiaceae bacterium]